METGVQNTSQCSNQLSAASAHGKYGWLKQRVCVEQWGSIDLLRSHPLEEHHFDSWWKPAAQCQNFLSTAKGQAFKPAYTAIFWLFRYLLHSLESG